MREDNCGKGRCSYVNRTRRTRLRLCACVLGEVRYFVVAKAVAQVETEEFTRVLQGFLAECPLPRPVKTEREQREKREYVGFDMLKYAKTYPHGRIIALRNPR